MTKRAPDLLEVLRLAVRQGLQSTFVATVGTIQAYDPLLQTVDVQPDLQHTTEYEEEEDALGQPVLFESENLPQLTAVPLVLPRAGSLGLTLPLGLGDRCLVVFCDRDLSAWWLSVAANLPVEPGDLEPHPMSGAVAIPGCYNAEGALTQGATTEIRLGNDLGVWDFVALAGSVLSELQDIKADLDAVKTTFDAHVHILAIAAQAGVGGTGTAAAPAVPIPAPHTPLTVAATDVKVT